MNHYLFNFKLSSGVTKSQGSRFGAPTLAPMTNSSYLGLCAFVVQVLVVFVKNLSPSTRSSPCHFSLFNASSLSCSLSSLQNSSHFLNFIPFFDFLEFGRGEFVLKFVFFFAKAKSHLGCPFV